MVSDIDMHREMIEAMVSVLRVMKWIEYDFVVMHTDAIFCLPFTLCFYLGHHGIYQQHGQRHHATHCDNSLRWKYDFH